VRKLSAALLLLLVAATSGEAEWIVTSANTEPGRGGLQHRHVVLQDAETRENATIDLALFSKTSCALRVIDQPTTPRNDLAQVMEQRNCLAGVNGGYFGPDYALIGLLIVDRNIIAPLQRARLLTGLLAASPRGVQILRIRELSPQQKLNAAVQCGPMLVDLGRRVRGLEETRTARRTFAAVGDSDRATLGFCSNVSLSDLAKILATPGFAEDFKIQRALNLDGGSSSAFWFARERGAFSISEQKTVRNFVAIVAR
jgi:uncharacterized protein YigE (DUF2233 family)